MNTVKGNAVTTVYEVSMRRIVAVELSNVEVLFGDYLVCPCCQGLGRRNDLQKRRIRSSTMLKIDLSSFTLQVWIYYISLS